MFLPDFMYGNGLAKVIVDYKEIYFALLGVIFTPALSFFIIYFKRAILLRRFASWCFENVELDPDNWCLLYLTGLIWYNRIFKLNKLRFRNCLENIEINEIKSRKVRRCLEKNWKILKNQIHFTQNIDFWRPHMQNILREFFKADDVNWFSNRRLSKMLQNAVWYKRNPLILFIIITGLMGYYVGCTQYVSNYYVIHPEPKERIKESHVIRDQNIIKNSDFRSNKRFWSIMSYKGKDGIQPEDTWVNSDRQLIVNTPNKSSVIIQQNFINLPVTQYHDFELVIEVEPGVGGNNAEIEIKFEDPIQALDITNSITPITSQTRHVFRLTPYGGVFNLSIEQKGMLSSTNAPVICKYSLIEINPVINSGIIAATILEKNYWGLGGERIKDFSIEDQGDVDYYKLYKYQEDGKIEEIYPKFSLSDKSSETYIPVKENGIYKLKATFGGITYAIADSIILSDDKGVAVWLEESAHFGRILFQVIDKNTNKPVPGLKIRIFSSEDEPVRGHFIGWPANDKDITGKDGRIINDVWLLSITDAKEFYRLELFNDDGIMYKDKTLRPYFDKKNKKHDLGIIKI
ncbi:MAG: hypothetical protein HQ568_01180 [Calditrichaeota bacterium]|nr:hypothetical protein [Calditrichota bacterium]